MSQCSKQTHRVSVSIRVLHFTVLVIRILIIRYCFEFRISRFELFVFYEALLNRTFGMLTQNRVFRARIFTFWE